MVEVGGSSPLASTKKTDDLLVVCFFDTTVFTRGLEGGAVSGSERFALRQLEQDILRGKTNS